MKVDTHKGKVYEEVISLKDSNFAVYILAEKYFYISNTSLHTMNVRMSLKIARRGLHKNNKATVLNHYLFGNLKLHLFVVGTVKLKGDYGQHQPEGSKQSFV